MSAIVILILMSALWALIIAGTIAGVVWFLDRTRSDARH
jgi:hypothetical protein